MFATGVKQQPGYDTGDYANEKMLLAGYHVETVHEQNITLGFDGLSGRIPLYLKYEKHYLTQVLLEAKHFRSSSSNGNVIRAMYGHLQAEKLYRKIFREEPKFTLKFSKKELLDILEKNPNLETKARDQIRTYFKKMEETYTKLIEHAL